MAEPTQADLERALADFQLANEQKRVSPPPPPIPIVTSETVELSGSGGFPSPGGISTAPPDTGGGTRTLYFIEDGVLYQGDFVVSNVTEVEE